MVDSHGWAIRGAGGTPDTSISTDLYYESRNSAQTPDMMDSTTAEAQKLTEHLDNEAEDKKQAAIDTMKAAAKELPTPASPAPSTVVAEVAPEPVSTLPSLDQIRAKEEATRKANADKASRDALALANALTEEAGGDTTKPIVNTPTETPVNTSVSTPDTGTMELTREQTNELLDTDLKVSTVAGLAKHKAEENKALDDGEEVTISFR